MKKKILIAEANELMRNEIRNLISKIDDVEIAAEACDFDNAMALISSLKPDIVILSACFCEIFDSNIIRHIKTKYPFIQILLICIYNDRKFVAEMIKAGINGYIINDMLLSEFQNAVNSILNNRIYICPSIY